MRQPTPPAPERLIAERDGVLIWRDDAQQMIMTTQSPVARAVPSHAIRTQIIQTGEKVMLKNLMTGTFLVLASAMAPAASPPSQAPAVTEVIVFDVGPNMAKFLALTKRANAITQKYGSTGKARFWANAYAGRESGTMVVTVEYPSLVSLAQSTAKYDASPEWRHLVADAQAASIKAISDSIVVEVPSGP